MRMGLFDKIKGSLAKTRQSFGENLNAVMSGFRHVDEDFLEELLEVLVMADVGLEVSENIVDALRRRAKLQRITTEDQLREALAAVICEEMQSGDGALRIGTRPSVILLVGVNGVGKTTAAAKLAYYLKNQGKKVLFAAADTFRAAAAEQLAIWAERVGVDIVRHNEGGDPAAVVFDAVSAAKARGTDVIICDTAGRLHNKKHLMEELTKIRRVIDRELPDADKEVLLVLDATTGQNALLQAKEFKDATDFTGIILTKLDGTAKGGMAIGVLRELGIPIKFVGLGEQMTDMEPFSAEEYARGLVSI
mgnify:CR=1 FL=1